MGDPGILQQDVAHESLASEFSSSLQCVDAEILRSLETVQEGIRDQLLSVSDVETSDDVGFNDHLRETLKGKKFVAEDGDTGSNDNRKIHTALRQCGCRFVGDLVTMEGGRLLAAIKPSGSNGGNGFRYHGSKIQGFNRALYHSLCLFIKSEFSKDSKNLSENQIQILRQYKMEEAFRCIVRDLVFLQEAAKNTGRKGDEFFRGSPYAERFELFGLRLSEEVAMLRDLGVPESTLGPFKGLGDVIFPRYQPLSESSQQVLKEVSVAAQEPEAVLEESDFTKLLKTSLKGKSFSVKRAVDTALGKNFEQFGMKFLGDLIDVEKVSGGLWKLCFSIQKNQNRKRRNFHYHGTPLLRYSPVQHDAVCMFVRKSVENFQSRYLSENELNDMRQYKLQEAFRYLETESAFLREVADRAKRNAETRIFTTRLNHGQEPESYGGLFEQFGFAMGNEVAKLRKLEVQEDKIEPLQQAIRAVLGDCKPHKRKPLTS